ncbi:MAG: leucyl/phenylalanyl-tRNA--protein transferase [Candidatus Thioglobus sp.]|uniref:leucyl/phenylalanyl-tRNA--protein transferase n=1 Tax=Candidatus Thioglobus sp. TaxID=2026721 RepID=UPI0026366012|nr:leucyl/phenylalanyl-tRNA--protein transferase [Candidatus Thioglobus sp.]MDC9726543.1 leucyl/phenylalanyl-tRNA--protein transferase [Candidatus Thioglobus sp.]
MIEIPQSFVLTDDDTPFANIEQALDEPNGLIAVGGALSTERLIDAYQRGIFPWYGEDEPVQWYSPNPRMVITPNKLHISKSLSKTLSQYKFNLKIDQDFDSVIRHCKTVNRKDQTGTWIDEAMIEAYTALHQQSVVKSVEVYQDDKLVGGLYGVAMGQVFFGESMFSLRPNVSKIAFVHLVQSMGYELIDCQVESPHLKSLGAFNIERSAFAKLLKDLL